MKNDKFENKKVEKVEKVEKELSKDEGLELVFKKSLLRETKECLFLKVFNDNWGVISFAIDKAIKEMQILKNSMECCKEGETQNKIISDELLKLKKYLEELEILKTWIDNPDLFKEKVEKQEKKFSTNKAHEFNRVGYGEELNPERLIRDFVVIRNFNNYKDKLNNSQIARLIEKYNEHPFIEPIKAYYEKIGPMREYLLMKEIEESVKSGFHKFWAALFSPNKCGTRKIEVGYKILENIKNDKEYDDGFSEDEKNTANDLNGRLFNNVVSKL